MTPTRAPGPRVTDPRPGALRQVRIARVHMIRRRVVAGALALFVATWLLITMLLITGHDPALGRQRTQRAATSTVVRATTATPTTTTTAGASAATTGAASTTPPSTTTATTTPTATTAASATSSSTAKRSSSSQTSAVTSRQS